MEKVLLTSVRLGTLPLALPPEGEGIGLGRTIQRRDRFLKDIFGKGAGGPETRVPRM